MYFNPLPILLFISGIYILLRIKFFYILHPCRAFGRAFSALRSPKNLSAFTLALAGTLGVGNVLGVAVGIMVGGAGSLFWLFLSAPISSALKYAEVSLSADTGGGTYHIIRASWGRLGRPLSALYAVLCLLLGLVMGAALQTKSIVDAIPETDAKSGVLIAAAVAVIVALSVVGGGKIIGKITLVIIPLTTIIYIITTFSTIAVFSERLPAVIASVISGAFKTEAGVGGALGFVTSRALREGFARGMLSNEAGAGTSTLAHANGDSIPPAERGLNGVLEVVFDTTLLCTLTGLAILCAVPDPSAFDSGMELVLAAVGSALGRGSSYLVTGAVFAFAYSTAVCWYYYATECASQLTGTKRRAPLLFVFILFVLLGGVISERLLVGAADFLLLSLTTLTLPVLIKNSDRVVALSESCGFIKSKESDS